MANLIGQGPVGAPHPTSVVATTPYPLKPGTRAWDASGNGYLYCDFTGTVFTGTGVIISLDGNFTASASISAQTRGPVGIACGAGTSDNAGWVQIFGSGSLQIASGDSAVSSAAVIILASSVSSPATAFDAVAETSNELNHVLGIWVTGSATTDTTSASSHTGVAVPVFLNFPFLVGRGSS